MKNKALVINGKIYARPSPEDSAMALRAYCGDITGFPSDSASTIELASALLNKGQLIYKHLLIEYKKQESNNIDLMNYYLTGNHH
tara:strand:+ start:63 stop:317 length:255 start_codon:yes stop_codon:yes gene_type:complete